MNLQSITLISFGTFEKELLEKTAEAVIEEFHIPVILREGHLDVSEFYDSARRQYNGNNLLKRIDLLKAKDSLKSIGIFSVDLFIPILTFIFGQAFLGGQSGIVSVYRLNNERYGMYSDQSLLLSRLKKVVIHELGHSFGLIHCLNSKCVMRSTTYVEDIDQKEQHLCSACRSGLGIEIIR